MNACEDVLLRSYITSAAIQELGLQSFDEWPTCIPKDARAVENRDERKEKMDTILTKIVDKFVNIQYHSPTRCKIRFKHNYAKELLTLGQYIWNLQMPLKKVTETVYV